MTSPPPLARPSGGISRWHVCLGALVALLAVPAADYLNVAVIQRMPYALVRSYTHERNPSFTRARWRGAEHAARGDFFQWWYVMLSDSVEQRTISIGFGGFRGDDMAGGWVRVKCGRHPERCPPDIAVPELWKAFSALEAHDDLRVHIALSSSNDSYFSLTPRNDTQQLHYTASLPEHDAEIDLLIARVYGTFSPNEECNVANLPFAYASRVTGHVRIGEHTWTYDDSPRYRAYAESTWGCTLPRPGPTGDAVEYPWKWMWLSLPDGGAYPRSGSLQGEVGIVVSNARMWDATLGSITGTFMFVDLPRERITATNVTAWDDTILPIPLMLTTDATAGRPLAVHMVHDAWTPYADAKGLAQLPLHQTLTAHTTRYIVELDFLSELADFTRLPVAYKDKHGRKHVCSDFRAAHSQANVRIFQRIDDAAGAARVLPEHLWACPAAPGRPSGGDSMCELLLSAEAPHNAIEFAYHAPYDMTGLKA